MNPRVREVCAGDGYTLNLTFDNGEERVFDAEPYLSAGVFRALRDRVEFVKVRPFLGSVAWPGGQDFCPDTLYEESVPATNPGRTPRARRCRVSARTSSR